jgi:hypothetical protein
MRSFAWVNSVKEMRVRMSNRQSGFLALALTSFVLAGAPQPAQAQYIQQGPKLIGTNGSTDAEQGYSVALSADGNTALVGGPYDNGQAGAVWFYTRSGGVWSQQGSKRTVTDNISNARFGWAVALSADGNTALIGGPRVRDLGVGARRRPPKFRGDERPHVDVPGAAPAGRSSCLLTSSLLSAAMPVRFAPGAVSCFSGLN